VLKYGSGRFYALIDAVSTATFRAGRIENEFESRGADLLRQVAARQLEGLYYVSRAPILQHAVVPLLERRQALRRRVRSCSGCRLLPRRLRSSVRSARRSTAAGPVTTAIQALRDSVSLKVSSHVPGSPCHRVRWLLIVWLIAQ